MKTTKYVYGNTVYYEDTQPHISHALYYLSEKLSKDESKVFFTQAKDHTAAQFEDDEHHNFILTYEGGRYVLASLGK